MLYVNLLIIIENGLVKLKPLTHTYIDLFHIEVAISV